MEEYGFPQWSCLHDDLKLKIISRMNYTTSYCNPTEIKFSRRLLRNCSKKDKQLVEMFPYRKEMHLQCALCPSTRKWVCKYFHSWYDVLNPTYKECFDTCEQAYDRMKQVIKTAETIVELVIDLKLNSRITLRDGKKRTNVEELCLNFIGGKNNEEKLECYSFLFSQINLRCLKTVSVGLDFVESCTPEQNDGLFELERTILNLESFNLNGLLSEEQFVGMRASDSILWNGECITPSGVVKFIKKQILQPTQSLSYAILGMSSELRSYFYGESGREYYPDFELLFNVVGSDLKLSIKLDWIDTRMDVDEDDENDEMMDNDPNLYCASLKIKLTELDNFLDPRPYETNTRSLELCPHLHNFISAISQVLPLGFPLMRDLRNQ